MKIGQTLRSGSFEFDLCQKSRGSSPKRTNSIPASQVEGVFRKETQNEST